MNILSGRMDMNGNMPNCEHCGNEIKKGIRTGQQNRALHQYFKLRAEQLNDLGLDMRTVLKPEFNMDWNTYTVKEYIWKPFMKELYGKQSTRELSKLEEIDNLHKHIERELGQKFGKMGVEYINFPSSEGDEKDSKGRLIIKD